MADGPEQLTRDELLTVVREQASVIDGLRETVAALSGAPAGGLVSRNSGNSSMPAIE